MLGYTSRRCWQNLATSSSICRSTQVLGRVEAHIDALRAQLNHKTTGMTTLRDDAGSFPGVKGGDNVPSAGGPRALEDPVAAAETNTSGEGVDTIAIETRGNYHLSPTPAERSGNEDGLTEAEDMRLNRLLRASSASASTPPSSGALTTPGIGKRGFLNAGGGTTNAKAKLMTMAEGEAGVSSNISGDFFGGICDASRELLGASPMGETGRSGKGSLDVSRMTASCREEQEDDLEDISDGGFHSGCWKRKYVRGEMR